MQKLDKTKPVGKSRIASPSSEGISRSMRSNRSKNTKPELKLRRALREAGMTGYRVHWKKGIGNPDIAFVGRKVAIFVHGCYWHQCPNCNKGRPQTNKEFWAKKFQDNDARDRRVTEELSLSGWTRITVWECQINKDIAHAITEIAVAYGK